TRAAEPALLAAAKAGDVDLVVGHLTGTSADLIRHLAQVRLDAGDDAGARRILDKGLEALFATDDADRAARVEELIDAILAVGATDAALAAIRRAGPGGQVASAVPPPGWPDTGPGALIRLWVRAGEPDAAVAW